MVSEQMQSCQQDVLCWCQRQCSTITLTVVSTIGHQDTTRVRSNNVAQNVKNHSRGTTRVKLPVTGNLYWQVSSSEFVLGDPSLLSVPPWPFPLVNGLWVGLYRSDQKFYKSIKFGISLAPSPTLSVVTETSSGIGNMLKGVIITPSNHSLTTVGANIHR